MDLTNPVELVALSVRRRFGEWIAEPAWSIDESVLICQDHYCGRKFSACGYQAVWFAEENQIKFYDPRGRLIEVDSPQAISGNQDTSTAPVSADPSRPATSMASSGSGRLQSRAA